MDSNTTTTDQLPTTIEEVLAAQGYTQESFDEWCEGLEPDEVAYRQAKLISKTLNGETIMDMADTDQKKYFPWFWVNLDPEKPAGFGLSYFVYDCSRTGAGIGARLALKDPKTARHAGEHFPEVYERFFAGYPRP